MTSAGSAVAGIPTLSDRDDVPGSVEFRWRSGEHQAALTSSVCTTDPTGSVNSPLYGSRNRIRLARRRNHHKPLSRHRRHHCRSTTCREHRCLSPASTTISLSLARWARLATSEYGLGTVVMEVDCNAIQFGTDRSAVPQNLSLAYHLLLAAAAPTSRNWRATQRALIADFGYSDRAVRVYSPLPQSKDTPPDTNSSNTSKPRCSDESPRRCRAEHPGMSPGRRLGVD